MASNWKEPRDGLVKVCGMSLVGIGHIFGRAPSLCLYLEGTLNRRGFLSYGSALLRVVCVASLLLR